ATRLERLRMGNSCRKRRTGQATPRLAWTRGELFGSRVLLFGGCAKISLDDGGVFADFFWGAGGDSFAVIENEDALADAHDDLHVVLDEQNGKAEAGAKGADHLH